MRFCLRGLWNHIVWTPRLTGPQLPLIDGTLDKLDRLSRSMYAWSKSRAVKECSNRELAMAHCGDSSESIEFLFPDKSAPQHMYNSKSFNLRRQMSTT